MKRLPLLIALITVILPGCTARLYNSIYSGTCDSLLVKPLHADLDHPFTSEEVIDVVEAYYGVQIEDIEVTRYDLEDDWQENVEWEDQGIRYTIVIRNGDLRVINVSDEGGRITAQRLIECVGLQPEWYRAIYGPRMERSGIDYYFELWFPSIGVISQSRGSASRPDKLPILTSEFIIEHIDIVSPGSLDEVYEKSYTAYLPFSLPLNRGTAWEDALQPRPWPENWEEVHFINGW